MLQFLIQPPNQSIKSTMILDFVVTRYDSIHHFCIICYQVNTFLQMPGLRHTFSLESTILMHLTHIDVLKSLKKPPGSPVDLF